MVGLEMKYEFVLGKASYIDHRIETLPSVHTGMCIQPWLSQPNTYLPNKQRPVNSKRTF